MINILKSGLKEMNNDIRNKKIQLQIANLLTLSRFFSPFILLPLYFLNLKLAFFLMILLFTLTDTFDGYFARKYNSVSLFGKYLDAVVDKIFVITLLIPVFDTYIFIFILLEIFISIVNLYAYQKEFNPESNKFGKIKTVFMFSFLVLVYLDKFIEIPFFFMILFFLTTLSLELVTLISYSKIIINKKK